MKKFLTIFLIIGISIPAVLFVAMIFKPTTESTDNRKLADFPGLTDKKGGLNLGFFTGFESWFKDHFAFRNELIYADARIQNDVFKVSNVESVISGKDGWLFYTSTLPDYLGTGRLSDREIYNIAHNLNIACEYVRGKGCNFVLTIPANKNTLYGEYMPYYDSYIIDKTHNTDVLTPLLEKINIPYADLVKTFKEQDEILYMKTDSHWNNRGAVLAYNTIMDTLGLAHDDYSGAEVTTTKEAGDLSRMMYTFYGQKEDNQVYNISPKFEYSDTFKSVEDASIQTRGTGDNGRLLMYRDSFGNTLIPLIANEFAEGFYSKANHYTLERQMNESNPDTVIFEKVERNIKEFITMPPVISAPVSDEAIPDIAISSTSENNFDVEIKPLEVDFDYYEISGKVDPQLLETDTDIFINVNGTTFKAYHTGDNGFTLYLKKENVSSPVTVRVLTDKGGIEPVAGKTFDIDALN